MLHCMNYDLEKDHEIENLPFHDQEHWVHGFFFHGIFITLEFIAHHWKTYTNTLHPTLWSREHFMIIPNYIHVREVSRGTNKFRSTKQRVPITIVQE